MSPYSTTDTKGICEATGYSRTKVVELRQHNIWIENIHWRYNDPDKPKGGIIYNLTLISHWQQTRHNPALHDLAIETYQAYLDKPVAI